jgi:protoporphyrin/coproporphyrin ferrochelatase
MSLSTYDAILLVSFGGPEGPEDVLPFMENVTRGRGIPRERLVEVSAHYALFDGVSPINGQNRALIAALRTELDSHNITLPIYWGNRNWQPLLSDTIETMRADGVRKALAFVTSAYSSASGCRQYREDIQRAREIVGIDAPTIDKIRVFYNHPGFIEPMVDSVTASVQSIIDEVGSSDHVRLVCTAHSIPMSMADTSDYVQQLTEASRLVCEAVNQRLGLSLAHELVFQSRSGAPGQPWLEPDICDHLTGLHRDGTTGAVMIPVGFISDHMEVMYDLDTQARERAAELGLPIRRAATVGTDSRFVTMIRKLIQERFALEDDREPIREALGLYGPNHDVCPINCCPMPQRPDVVRPAMNPTSRTE